MEQWHKVAEIVKRCTGETDHIEADGCAKLIHLCDTLTHGMVLHGVGTGQPIWYSAAVQQVVGVPWHHWGPDHLVRLLAALSPSAMAVVQGYLHWGALGHSALHIAMAELSDTRGNLRHYYTCSGKLTRGQGRQALILTILFDVDRLLADNRGEKVDALHSAAYHTLTEREKEVFAHLAHGMKNTEIAQKIHISGHTVQTHRKNILKKLRVSNPLALAAYMPLVGSK